MAGIQMKKMNWVKPQSAYDSMQAWRAKRQAAVAEFESLSTATASAFSAAWSNQISGLGELAANAALQRVSAEGKAKIDAATSSIDVSA
ncbi:hypothetical protein [Pseudorhodoplanes sinuspersici]|nr:hypothetical protein [Pseudorhodoplanes sinuspersici]RKE70723.1 hypothetical protein DFP91_2966 [Pseudorhodoplanes sinuspersici]